MDRFPTFDFHQRVSEFFISVGTMSHIFGLRYLSALKLQLTAFTDRNGKLVCEKRLNTLDILLFKKFRHYPSC